MRKIAEKRCSEYNAEERVYDIEETQNSKIAILLLIHGILLYNDNLFDSKEAFLEKLLVRQMSRESPKSAVIPIFFRSGKCRVIFDTFMMQV